MSRPIATEAAAGRRLVAAALGLVAAAAVAGAAPPWAAPRRAAPRAAAAPAAAARALVDPAIPAAPGASLAPVIVVLRGAPAGPAAPPPGRTRASAALAARRRGFTAAGAPLAAALEALAARGAAARVRPLWAAHAYAAEVAPDALAALAARPDVRLVVRDGPFRLAPDLPAARAAALDDPPAGGDTADVGGVLWNVARVRADAAWRRLGVDGAGAVVGFLDSGVDYHHPLLTTRYRGYVAGGPPRNAGNWWCKAAEDALCGFGSRFPVDGLGHGTHVAGTAVAGDGIGVAPGARWMAVRVCAAECRNSWLVEGLQWLLEQPAELLPDVLNASLSTDEDLMTRVLEPVVDALVEAGVVVVASTGNGDGPLGAPAVLPSAIGVGAITPDGTVWKLSRTGRTAWGETKPDLVAPGTAITSTVPGGGRFRLNGTSMAAPHVAGAAALLRAADPTLSPGAVKEILLRTAAPIGSGAPGTAAGHGLLDAYAAVASVTDVGIVRGSVTRAPDGAPIPWARVRVAELDGDPVVGAAVEADGSFVLGLRPGAYLVIAEAFGYREETRRGVVVRDDDDLTLPAFALPRDDPQGIFAGDVADALTGAPLDVAITLADVPFPILSDAFGLFDRQLPARTYAVRVARFGYRVLTDTVKIGPDETVRRAYRLTPAPRILLVDGDAWAYSGALDAYRRALDALGYVFDEHLVTDDAVGPGQPGGPPDEARLAKYDLVIWSSTLSGPAFVRGATPLNAYLGRGGRLLVAGQDAMCVDAGIDVHDAPCARNARPHPYVRARLFLRVVADNAFSQEVTGLPDGPLAGLRWTLNGPGGLGNQSAPDVLEVTDGLHARPIAAYGAGGAGGAAGILVDRCTDHRAVALGFGLEGISEASDRRAVLGRLIDALMAEAPARGVHLAAVPAERVRPPGFTAEFTVTLTSTGARADAFGVAVADADWPSTLWSSGFTAPLTGTLALQRCQSAAVGVRVTIPRDADRGALGRTTLVVAGSDGAAAARTELVARAPAPVLLVDGDFVTDSEARYEASLAALGVPFDRYRLGLGQTRPTLPAAELLAQYPAVVWFTGYDFRPNGTLDLAGQALLADYLEGGGRLLFASEDYLRSRGAVPYRAERLFHRDYLGAARYDDDGGDAHTGALRGAPGSLLDGLTDCRLAYPGRDYSDRLEPTADAMPLVLNRFDQPIGLAVAARRFRAIFLAFDAGLLDARCAAALHARALDWFGPLADSTLRIVTAEGQPESRRTFAAGDVLHLELTARTDGTRSVDGARVSWALPAGLTPDPDTLPPTWAWDPSARVVTWRGEITATRPARARLAVTLDADLPEETLMSSTAVLVGDGLAATRGADWRVNAPDLGGSTKTASPAGRPLDFGAEVTFAVTVRNDGTRDAAFAVTDTLPAGLRLTPGSWYVSDPADAVTADAAAGTLRWRGRLAPRRVATLQYRARVVSLVGGVLRNRALVDDGTGVVQTISAAVFVRPRVLLPWLGAEVDEDP